MNPMRTILIALLMTLATQVGAFSMSDMKENCADIDKFNNGENYDISNFSMCLGYFRAFHAMGNASCDTLHYLTVTNLSWASGKFCNINLVVYTNK